MEQIQIRRAEWTDRELIFSFYQKAYPDWDRRVPERWDWQVLNNPFRPEGPPPVWLAIDVDDRIIGQTMAMFEPMQMAGEVVLNGWSVDSFVMESYRGKGIGRRLRELMNQEVSQIMSIMMSPATRHIYETQGFQALPQLEVYLLAVDPKNLTESLALHSHGCVQNVLKIINVGQPVSWVVNLLTARRRRAASPTKSNLIFQEAQGFPEQVDEIWQQLQSRFDGVVVRSAQYLNWKYISQPHIDYNAFLIYEDNNLLGYLVLRQGKTRGFVVDFLLDPDEPHAIYQAMDFAVSFFLNRGIREVRAGSSYGPYQDCLRSIGWPNPADTRLPLVKSSFMVSADPISAGAWLFSLGDHDMQQ